MSRSLKSDLDYCRTALASYERIRQTALQLRAEETAAGADLRTRIAWASVIDQIDGMVALARRQLRKAKGRAAAKAVQA